MLTNLLSQVGKIKRDGKTTHTCFYLENKTRQLFRKKAVCVLEDMEKSRHAKLGFQDGSQALHDSVSACVDF